MSRLEWNGDAAEVFVRGELLSTLMVIGQAGEDPGEGVGVDPGVHRVPRGHPPHMDTGALHDSITHEVDAGRWRSGSGPTSIMGFTLEVGTSRMAARPWLRRASMDVMANIGQILSGIGSSTATVSRVSRPSRRSETYRVPHCRWFKR